MDTYASGVGLYSIGVRTATVPDLAAWAARHEIPFLHLRGGARGYDVTRRPQVELDRWRAITTATAPIRLLTTDITVHDVTGAPSQRCRAAQRELERAADCALRLGTNVIRILADRPESNSDAPTAPLLPGRDIVVLIEPHHPSWWQPLGVQRLTKLCRADKRIGLLADTAQAAIGFAELPRPTAQDLAQRIIGLTRVVHLSDNGSGLHAAGHELLASSAARALAEGFPIEIAFEWTGAERTPSSCLNRYRDACAWWHPLAMAAETGSVR